MLNVSIVCFIICFGVSEDDLPTPPVSDFCQRYERQVLTPGELEAIKKLPRSLRDRVQGNDLDYLCQCQNWQSPRCKVPS